MTSAKKEITPSECVTLADVKMHSQSIMSKYVGIQLISFKEWSPMAETKFFVGYFTMLSVARLYIIKQENWMNWKGFGKQ
jgi:hypothetical protein